MSDIATNDDLPALEIVAPFDTLPLEVPCAGISIESMVTAAPTPSAEDQQVADPLRPRAGTMCTGSDLIIQREHRQLPLDESVGPLLEREQAEARLPVRGDLAVECKKARTEEQGSAEDVITAAKEAPATKMFASETQAEEKDLLAKDTDSKLRKYRCPGLDIPHRNRRDLLANECPFFGRAIGGDKWISAEASVPRPAHRLVAGIPCVGAGYRNGGEPGGDEDLGCQTNADLGGPVDGSQDEDEDKEDEEEEENEEVDPPAYEFNLDGMQSSCGTEIIREDCSCCDGVCDRSCVHKEYVSGVHDISHPETTHYSPYDLLFGDGGLCGGVFSPPESSRISSFNFLFGSSGITRGIFQYKHEGPDNEGNVPLFRIEGRALRSSDLSTEPDPTITYSNKAYNVPADNVVILSSPYRGRVWVRANDRITVNLRQVCGGKDEEETIRIRTDHPLYRVGDCNGSDTKYQMDPNLEGYLSCSVAASKRDIELIFTDSPRRLTQEELANEKARCAPLAHGWHLFMSATFNGKPETTMLPLRLIHDLFETR
jgi:hypothetical protein